MNPDEQDAKKLLLVKIGIIIIAVAILFLWLANLRGVFENQKTTTDKTWEKISEDLNQSFKDAENRFSEVASSSSNSFVKELISKASSTASSTIKVYSTSTDYSISTSSEIKKELMDLIKISTTTPKNSNCPPYINCMPSIGEARPCIIPDGCEGITQIAY